MLLHDPGVGLGGHGHEGKLICVGRVQQLREAQQTVILPALFVGALGDVLAADSPPHRAAHADLPFDAALDLRDQILAARRAQHVGVPFQIAVGVPRRGQHAVLLHDLGPVDPGRLPFGGPIVVKNTAFAQKHRGQLLQRLQGEALPVPVHLVVTQAHAEGIYFFSGQRSLTEPINQGQFLQGRLTRCARLGRFPNVHVVPPSNCWAWAW